MGGGVNPLTPPPPSFRTLVCVVQHKAMSEQVWVESLMVCVYIVASEKVWVWMWIWVQVYALFVSKAIFRVNIKWWVRRGNKCLNPNQFAHSLVSWGHRVVRSLGPDTNSRSGPRTSLGPVPLTVGPRTSLGPLSGPVGPRTSLGPVPLTVASRISLGPVPRTSLGPVPLTVGVVLGPAWGLFHWQ